MNIKSRIIKLENALGVKKPSFAQVMMQCEAEIIPGEQSNTERQANYKRLIIECDCPQLKWLYQDILDAIIYSNESKVKA